MRYSFDTEIAARYGVEEAILLDHIRFWCDKNQSNPDCQKEGRCWMYASAARLAEHFSFWSVPQIRRLLKSLVRQGALLEGRFGRFAFDRTLWYAISESAASMFQNRHLQQTNPQHSNDASERAIKDTQKDIQEDTQHTYTACGGRASSPPLRNWGTPHRKQSRSPNSFQPIRQPASSSSGRPIPARQTSGPLCWPGRRCGRMNPW